MHRQIVLTLASFALTIGACSRPADSPSAPPTGAANSDSSALRVAVVTGGHSFDVQNFYRLFRELPGIDAYPQHLEHFSSSPEEVRDAYDAVVFYGMGSGVPVEEGRITKGSQGPLWNGLSNKAKVS